jgi:phosphoribosylformylglycinamidine cyclo-ligase
MTTYGEAGVDLEGAERHVRAIADSVTATWSDDVIGGFGGFAAGVTIPAGYRRPVLMMSTDGVGTKLELARLASNWDGVGFDLVAMCVDDLAAVGARPIGFVDYLAVGALDPGRDRAIVASVAAACARAGCALLGGETAEHPGVMPADAVDLAGAVMGVVEAGEELGPHRVEAGDLVVALASPNLRSNGFSLVRSALGETVSRHFDLLLQPSVIYSPAVSAATLTGAVHAAAHITGGGLPGNLARVLPDGLGIEIDTGTWRPPEVFDLIASAGVARDEMFSTFNMGVGFCLITPEARGDEVMALLSDHEPWVAGRVVEGRGVGLT